MKLRELAPNVKNPRKITDERLKGLKKSLDKFGDLSGIVFNRRTGALISGHQRQKILPANAEIHLEKKFDVVSNTGTIAEGYIEVGGERFKYREVDLPPELEAEAMLAANNQGGENDIELLKMLFTEFPDMDLEVAGVFPPMEIDFSAGTIDDQGQLDQKKLVIMECPHCAKKFEQQQAKIIN